MRSSERRRLPPAARAARPAADRDPHHAAAGILAVQRAAGNRAAVEMLRRRGSVAVQREDGYGPPAYGVRIEGTDDTSLIHRVEPAEGSEQNTVRCYLTVFGRAEKGSSYKDIHTDTTDKIVFVNKTEDTMLNMGDPRRAFHYIRTYMNQDSPAQVPIIRSFDIPRALYDEVTGAAISEAQRGKLGRDKPYNVDKERGQNQFGLPPSARDKIEAQGKNLTSYVHKQHVGALSAEPSNGVVQDIDVLLSTVLGMPDTEHRKYLAPMRGSKVQSPRQEAEHGTILSRLYDDLGELVAAKLGQGDKPVIVYNVKIKGRCVPGKPDYYGDVIAPLVEKEGYLAGWSVAKLQHLQDQVGRAATFSVIPQMVTEEYLQANARLHGQDRDKNDKQLSSWAAQQNYAVVEKPVAEPPQRRQRGTGRPPDAQPGGPSGGHPQAPSSSDDLDTSISSLFSEPTDETAPPDGGTEDFGLEDFFARAFS